MNGVFLSLVGLILTIANQVILTILFWILGGGRFGSLERAAFVEIPDDELEVFNERGRSGSDRLRHQRRDVRVLPRGAVLDTLVHSAEQGATWALKYPLYSALVLKNVKHNTVVAYAIAKGDLPFLEYLNYWLKLKKLNKVTDQNYKYWVLGEVPELKKRRWCVLRDVLHWLD
ncbi:MAG: hypothetical protein GXP32_06640 [Kiritimatiellaeota bacterium]|nr:hypothetical protein [Kiritimatiellota bacterium]